MFNDLANWNSSPQTLNYGGMTWSMDSPALRQQALINAANADNGQSNYDLGLTTMYTPMLKSIGYTGPPPFIQDYTSGANENVDQVGYQAGQDAFAKYLADRGLTLGTSYGGGGGLSGSTKYQQYFDASGKPVGDMGQVSGDNILKMVSPILLAAGAAALGPAGGVAGAGEGAGTAALSSADKLALFGDLGYGGGAIPSAIAPAGALGGAGEIAGVAGSYIDPATVQSILDSTPSAAGGLTSEQMNALLGPEAYGAAASPAELAAYSGFSMPSLGDVGSFLKDNSSLINVGGNLLSGYLGNKAAGKAADAQIQASREANQLAKYIYDTTRNDYAPYRAAGGAAVTRAGNLLANPSSITSDPGYGFGLSEGTKAIDRSAASRGSLYSGATLKALQKYGQDYAGTKLTEAVNRNLGVAGLGQVATSGTSNAGANYSNTAGNNLIGAGNANASSYVGGANAWTNALGGATNSLQQQAIIDALLKRNGG